MKVLNLYAGIGGNRKLWQNVDVTAIENNPQIAKIYQDLFPNDKVLVKDAHKFLLNHYKKYDFIWSSPPCPTHSDIRRCGVHRGQNEALYPDMKLYEEIILLKHFAPKETKWVVENVASYYKPLIKPFVAGRHYFWANFYVPNFGKENQAIHNEIVGSDIIYGFDLNKYYFHDKRKLLRNCVNPELGLHVFECATKGKQAKLGDLNG